MNVWKMWLIGLWSSLSSGVTTAISTNLVDPHDFNIYTKKFWACAGASASVSAVKYIVRTRFRISKEGKIEPDESNTSTS